MEQTQDMGATSASAGAATANDFGATRSTNLNSTKELETTVREGMSLIDRFYNGGNRARPAALDILVVVLDGVVRRMRQQYENRNKHVADGDAEIARLEQSIADVKKQQAPLVRDLEIKKARAAVLDDNVKKGASTIEESIRVARAAVEKATLIQRHTEKASIAALKLSNLGYDGKGKPIQGREVNLRKKDGGPGARRPGDMVPTSVGGRSDDTMLLERAHTVLRGERLGAPAGAPAVAPR